MIDIIPPHSRKLIKLGIKIAIPPGLYGRIASRSGLAANDNTDVGTGVIDPDYRGEVKVLLINSSQKRFPIHKGDKIAQIIFERFVSPGFKTLAFLNNTQHQNGSFGSTGQNVTSTSSSTEPTRHSPSSPTDLPQQQTTVPPPNGPQNTTNPSISPSPVLLSPSPPPIQTVDRPQSSAPVDRTFTIKELQKCLGHRNIAKHLPIFKQIFQPNFHIANLDPEPILDLGTTATIDSRASKTSIKPPKQLGDVMHCDISYGCNAGLNGIKY